MKKRFLALFLFISMLAAIGCGESIPEQTDTEPETTAAETSKTPEYNFTIAKEDNGGETVSILVSKHAEYEFLVEKESGDIVEDAVYNRNRMTEELLGVELTFESRANFGGSDTSAWLNTIKQSILADDDAYQIINGINVWTSQLIPDGLFMNMNDIKSINFDNPWWVAGFPLGDGGVYYAFNDAAFSLYKDLYVIFFNRNIIESFKLADPYELVSDGKWTLESFIGMTKDISHDLNNDGKIDVENDRISYLYKHAANRAFLISAECSIVEEKDGAYKLRGLSERLVNAYDTLRAFLSGNDSVYCSMEADYVKLALPFIEGRSLFMNNCLSAIEGMRDMTDDFGIIPLPKYDDNQVNYHSQIATSAQAFYLPVSIKNPELVGKVSEALSYYSHIDVIPKYYDVALKDKYTRDETVKEMLDIIRKSATASVEFQFSTMFTNGWPNDLFNQAIADIDIVSYYAARQAGWQATLDMLSTKELP